MTSDSFYPFGLPGINHPGAAGQGNPLTASLDLMRQAMSSFGQSASLASGTMAQSLNPEDLERRISELKVVENWLKLNLSMLSGSIQGMEVQLATIKTLRSFVEMGSQPVSEDGQQPSPLEVVLGIRRPPAESPAATVAPESTPAPAPQPRPEPEAPSTGAASHTHNAGSSDTPGAGEGVPGIPGMPNTPESSQAAAQAWWDMLQNQFSQIAAATTQAAQFAKPEEVGQQTASEADHKPRARKKMASKSATRSGSTTRARKSSASRPVKNTKS
ncbi:PhaM family polyhydroxyalkanoate granule multifunctional regulatory protein [Orrella marina]|nr:PhaM family polyhydroxyalkanoate granule multifunctional regulatory protein [Orrella marina]